MLLTNNAALEPATRKTFLVFMEEFLKSLFPGFFAVPVTGMKAMTQPMTVTETHLKLQHVGYNGGPLPVTLSLASDALISPNNQLKQKPKGIDKQNYFINCNANIEMKRWRLLFGKINNSPMAQVCAKSMCQKTFQTNSSKQFLFSILTDFVGVYVLCHDKERNEYWISRQENDPERIVSILIWLMQLATSSSEDPDALRQFLSTNVCPDADR